jgi:DNA invertase Pin-like site-specific DNA recombinase
VADRDYTAVRAAPLLLQCDGVPGTDGAGSHGRTYKAGLQAAREQGRVGGRKRVMTDSKIRSARNLLSQGIAPKDVAKDLGVSVPTLYRWVPATDNAKPSVT